MSEPGSSRPDAEPAAADLQEETGASAIRAAAADLRRHRNRLRDLAVRLDRRAVPYLVRHYDLPQVTHALRLDRLAHIEARKERLRFVEPDGHALEIDAGHLPGRLFEQLARHPQLARTKEHHLANLHRVRAIRPSREKPGERLLSFAPGDGRVGAVAPLSPAHGDEAMAFFGIPNLDHVVPWNERYQLMLDENLRLFEHDIRTLGVEELRREFRFPTTGGLNQRELMANLIWQYYHWLKLPPNDPRHVEPIDGNIRTFWYYIKPVFARLGVLDPKHQYEVMLDVFNQYVARARFFHYRDFGFYDEGESTRRLAPKDKRPEVLLVAEKSGHFRKLQRLQDEFGFSIIALGGQPSLLTIEYLVDELADVVDLRTTPLRLIALVDYDPSGEIIFGSFCNRLLEFGIKGYTRSLVLTPARFEPGELPTISFPVPMNTAGDRTKAKRWIEHGGGIDGQPLGIECEALVLDFPRFREIVKKLVEELAREEEEIFAPGHDALEGWGLPGLLCAELEDASG